MAATAHAPHVMHETDESDLPAASVVVGEGGRFEGLITFRGRARIDGEVVGEIVSRGSLRLGEMARVEATIEVDELVIGGTFDGEATATDRIELLSTARVTGTIRAPRFAMADGCTLEGRCETTPTN